MKRIAATVIVAVLAGCAGNSPDLNEGFVRAGFTPATDGNGAPISAMDGTTVLYEPSPAGGGGNSLIIAKDEKVMISMLSGFICDFREFGGVFNAIADSNNEAEPCEDGVPGFLFESRGKATRGEIAITASYEVRGSDTDDDKDRVIYYNDDVRETGQPFNFQNLPVYGPVGAPKASSILTVRIMELDQEEADQAGAVIDKLADLGQQFASPLSLGAFSVLTDLGTTFVKSNKDDRELEFTIGFDPAATNSQVYRNQLREGYFALIRRENRDEGGHFDKVAICPGQGIIADRENVDGSMISAKAACDRGEFYRKHTWLLLRISREDDDVTEAQFRKKLFSELVESDLFQNGDDLEALGKIVDDFIDGLK